MAKPGPGMTMAAAMVHYRAGRLDEAEAICRQLVKRNKRDVNALQMLGTLATRRNDFGEALKHYRRCLALRPSEAHFHYLVGKIDALQGRFDQAIARYDRALRLKPGDRLSAGWKAAVLERRGSLAEAEATLAPFIEAGTEDADMAEVQAKIDLGAGRDTEAAAIATRHLADRGIGRHSRIALAIVAGKAYERMGEHDKSFDAYRQANEAMEASFDPNGYVDFIDRLIGAFSPQAMAGLPRAGVRAETPVFIAGMPRSGTTLVEQIIDAPTSKRRSAGSPSSSAPTTPTPSAWPPSPARSPTGWPGALCAASASWPRGQPASSTRASRTTRTWA